MSMAPTAKYRVIRSLMPQPMKRRLCRFTPQALAEAQQMAAALAASYALAQEWLQQWSGE